MLYLHFTKFKLDNKNIPLHEIENKIIIDEERNAQIINDVTNAYEENKKILILTNRIEHAKKLFFELKQQLNNTFLIYGDSQKDIKETYFKKINDIKNESFIIISTGKYIGEGFDENRLDTLFLTMPFKWKGTLQQYVGRINRENANKTKVEVHDYIDINVFVLYKMFIERQKGYKSLNYTSIDEKTREEIIFDDKNYFNKLVEDLEQAENIRFYIQYAKAEKLKILLTKSKIKPNIYSSFEIKIDNLDYIKNDDIYFNIIIINENILWYGGINPFSFKNEDKTIARVEDKMVCQNIINDYFK